MHVCACTVPLPGCFASTEYTLAELKQVATAANVYDCLLLASICEVCYVA